MNGVVYFSRGGNTKKLADAIAKGAGASAAPMKEFKTTEALDILFIGASIYAGIIDGDLRQFLSALKPSQLKRAVVFGTAAGKKTAVPEVKSILEANGVAVSDEEFHCRGSFLFVNRGRPNEEDLRQAEAFAKGVVSNYHG
jgi:flavodoxin